MEQQVVRKRSFQHIILKRLYLHKTLGDRTYLKLILGQGQFKKKGSGLLDQILCRMTSLTVIKPPCQSMDCFITKFSADPYILSRRSRTGMTQVVLRLGLSSAVPLQGSLYDPTLLNLAV
jgi:hypothetical protein